MQSQLPSSQSAPLPENPARLYSGGIWDAPTHKELKQNLISGLHTRQEGNGNTNHGYGPALLPVNQLMTRRLHQWLRSHTEGGRVHEDDYADLIQSLAELKTAWINHYRLCKPLTYQTLPYACPDHVASEDTLSMLRELAVHVQVLKTSLVDVLHWPEAFWDVMLQWMALTIPVLYALGYHDAEAHAAQVSRWCVLVAHIKQPNQPWFQLQAALVGWFHDPKLQVCMSIDNVATHPVLASCLADTFLMEEGMAAVLDSAKRSVALPDDQSLETFRAEVVEALAINSDSRYVTDNFVLPAVRRQLPTDALMNEFSEWLHAWNNPLETVEHHPMSKELRQCMDKAAMGSGLLTLSAPVWQQACQWWQHTHGPAHANSSWVMGLTPDDLYAELMIGNPQLEEAVYPLQQWLRQAFLMGEQAYYTWRVPASLLLTHHKRVASPLLAECLAAADPLMLSPHKIIQARGVRETCVERVQSYLSSFQHNIADLRRDDRLPDVLVESWHRRVLLVIAQVAEVVTATATVQQLAQLPTADLHKAVGQSELWGELATVNETTEGGIVQMERIIRLMKQAFETAESATVDEVFSASFDA